MTPATRQKVLVCLVIAGCVGGVARALDDTGATSPLRLIQLIVSGPSTLGDLTVNGDAGVVGRTQLAGEVTALGYVSGRGDAGVNNLTSTGGLFPLMTSGDGVTFANNATEIQWPAANATLRGNASGTQTAGTFTAAGEVQPGPDGIRSEGTGAFDTNNHSTNGTTGYTWDRSVDLTSGNFGCWRDNGTTALTCLSWAGNLVFQSTDSTGSPGAATIDKPCGRSAVAAGAASVVITNSTVAATSNVQVTPLSSSAVDCAGWYVSAVGAGSFTLTCPAGNVVGNWSFMWCAFGAQ
jgi:hypothetical protein